MSKPPRTAVTIGELGGIFPRVKPGTTISQERLNQIAQQLADMINQSGGVVPEPVKVLGLFTPEERNQLPDPWFVLLNINLQRQMATKGLRTVSLGPPSAPRRTPNEVYERQAVLDRFRLRR